LSKPNQRRCGRPGTTVEIRRLIERMAAANPLWRAPRIHGELKMLGIEVAERTVSRILRKLPRPPSQTWKTFLHNHVGQMVSIDFFTVPTITMKVLFVFIVLEHSRRQVLHFNVTEYPSAAWTSQQIVEAFAEREAPRYLIRDRDGVYGKEVRLRIASLQIEEVLTAPQSPWQNPYAERLIGSIRRDCLNHFAIVNTRHLKRTLASYFTYYHGSRTHLGLDKQCPFTQPVSSIGKIIQIPQLGGLHHRYERIAA
jgi:transposase InsO family protein